MSRPRDVELFRTAMGERVADVMVRKGGVIPPEDKVRCADCNISRGTHRFIEESPIYRRVLDHPFVEPKPDA